MQVPGPRYGGLIVQIIPPATPTGKGSSFSTALNAVPVPAALLLLTLIVKPIVAPVGTGVTSAVFVMLRLGGGGGSTVMLALDDGPACSLSAETEAVFTYVPALDWGGARVPL